MPAPKCKSRVGDVTTTDRQRGIKKHASPRDGRDRTVNRSKSTRLAKSVSSNPEPSKLLSRSQSVHEPNCTTLGVPSFGRESSVKRRRDDDDPSTPSNKRFKNALPPTPAETPTKGTGALFDDLDLSPCLSKVVLRDDSTAYSTPPLTPASQLDQSENVSQPLQDLGSLFSSFLSAISLYLAHHGMSSSLYLSDILQLTMQSWKKRRVTTLDVQRLLGLLDQGDKLFELVGSSANVHLEVVQHSMATVVANQQVLHARFDTCLRRRWSRWLATAGPGTEADFITSLPLAPVRFDKSEAAKNIKGHERLSLLKQDSEKARTELLNGKKPSVSIQAKTVAGVSSRGTKLFDRVLARQEYLASCPKGPTPEEMARNAALDRIEEAAMTMGLLVGTKSRVSFSQQSMIKHLQDSMRNPISKEEAEMCLELMAGRVVPGFVSLVKNGSVCAVVIRRAGRPSCQELQSALTMARTFIVPSQ